MIQECKVSPEPNRTWRSAIRDWITKPWIMIGLASLLGLCLWVAIGMWIEHRRESILTELEKTPGVSTSVSWYYPYRYPIWFPARVGWMLPEDADVRVRGRIHVEFYQPPTSQQLDLMNRISGLEGVHFHDSSGVSDEVLLNLIETHQELMALAFHRPRKLTHQHLAALAKKEIFTSLKGIEGPFDQTTVDAIADIPLLTSVTLHGPATSSVRLSSLSRLARFDYLTWHDSRLTDDQFLELTSCAALHGLTLRATQLTPRSWPLFTPRTLQSLDLESPHIDDHLIDYLIAVRALSDVCLRGGRISDQALERLLSASDPCSVEIDTRGLSVEAMKQFSTKGRLGRIVLRGDSQVTDEWLAELADERINELEILNSSITDRGVELLRNNASLDRLALPGSKITDASMDVFNTLSDLRYLDLRDTEITDAGLQLLYIATDGEQWRWLHVGGTRVTQQGAREFVARYPYVSLHGVEGVQPIERDEWVKPLDKQKSH